MGATTMVLHNVLDPSASWLPPHAAHINSFNNDALRRKAQVVHILDALWKGPAASHVGVAAVAGQRHAPSKGPRLVQMQADEADVAAAELRAQCSQPLIRVRTGLSHIRVVADKVCVHAGSQPLARVHLPKFNWPCVIMQLWWR